MNYTIDNENAIKVFNDGDTVPFCFQPTYPNGDTFDTKEEATAWAKALIAALQNKDAPYAPNGKGIKGESKSAAKEFAEQTLLNN